MAAAVVLSVALAAAGPAVALPATGVVITPAGYGDVRLGPYDGPVGSEEHGYCVQARVTPTGPTDRPEQVLVVHDAALAWAFGTYRHSTDDLTQAALALTAHERQERPGTMEGGNVVAARAAVLAATPGAVIERYDQIMAEAAAQAGPYTAGAGEVVTGDRRTGVIHGIALRSAAGEPVVGKPFTVTLTGPAVFDLTGTATFSGTTGPVPLDLAWTATGNGEISVEVRFHGATRTTLTLFDMAGNRQDQLTYGNRPGFDPETVIGEVPPFPVLHDFQPVAVSDVDGSKVVETGAPLTDTLTVSAAPGEEWLTVDGAPVPVVFEGTAYGVGSVPAPESATVPDDARVVAETTLTAAGPGVYTATADGLATGQVVTWVWRVVKTHQPDELRDLVRGDWSDSFGLPAETTSVRWPDAHVDSALSIRETQGGRYLVDDLYVTGFPDDHPEFPGGHGLGADTAAMAQELWFFPSGIPVTDEDLASAELVGSVDVPAANGFVPSLSSPAFRVQVDESGRRVPGTYVFRTVFAGDDRVAPLVSSVADVTEQHLVTEPVEEPLDVTTVAHAGQGLVRGEPASVQDTALVSGPVPEGTTLEFALYRWEGALPVCSEDTLVQRLDAVPLTAPGEHLSARTELAEVGDGRYGYVETVRSADGQIVHRGECGIAPETLTVVEPVTPDEPAPEPGEPVAAAPADGPLATTGAVIGPALGLAVLLLVTGAVAVRSHRRAGRSGGDEAVAPVR